VETTSGPVCINIHTKLGYIQHSNFVTAWSQNNSKGFKVDKCKTINNYIHLFFIGTAIDWNNVDITVCSVILSKAPKPALKISAAQ
jgi:hypothetical protein